MGNFCNSGTNESLVPIFFNYSLNFYYRNSQLYRLFPIVSKIDKFINIFSLNRLMKKPIVE